MVMRGRMCVCVCVCVWVNNGWVGIGTLTKRKQGQHKLH